MYYENISNLGFRIFVTNQINKFELSDLKMLELTERKIYVFEDHHFESRIYKTLIFFYVTSTNAAEHLVLTRVVLYLDFEIN